MRTSTSVQIEDLTILGAARAILAAEGRPMGPYEVAQAGLDVGIFRVPRFRTRAYLTQLVQSVLHDNSQYSRSPRVYRPAKGLYSSRLSRKSRK